MTCRGVVSLFMRERTEREEALTREGAQRQMALRQMLLREGEERELELEKVTLELNQQTQAYKNLQMQASAETDALREELRKARGEAVAVRLAPGIRDVQIMFLTICTLYQGRFQ